MLRNLAKKKLFEYIIFSEILGPTAFTKLQLKLFKYCYFYEPRVILRLLNFMTPLFLNIDLKNKLYIKVSSYISVYSLV